MPGWTFIALYAAFLLLLFPATLSFLAFYLLHFKRYFYLKKLVILLFVSVPIRALALGIAWPVPFQYWIILANLIPALYYFAATKFYLGLSGRSLYILWFLLFVSSLTSLNLTVSSTVNQ